VTDSSTPARRPVEDRPVRVVSARPSFALRLREIWDARELLTYFIITDIKIKYKASALGLLWSMFAPAATLAIYWVVFGLILKNNMPAFALFLFAGLLVWNFFFSVIITSTSIVVDRAGIVKKVAFPREILALSTVGTSFIYFLIQSGVMVVFMVAFWRGPDWTMIWLLPLSIFSLAIFAGSLGILLSAINVYLRDTRHLIEVALQMWFFLTPIIYSFEAQVSKRLHHVHGLNLTWLYLLNPVTPTVMTFQRVIYATPVVQSLAPGHPTLTVLPTWPMSTYVILNLGVLAAGVALFAVAISVFGRLEGNFAEEL